MWRTKHIQKPGLVSRSGGCINSYSFMEPAQRKKHQIEITNIII